MKRWLGHIALFLSLIAMGIALSAARKAGKEQRFTKLELKLNDVPSAKFIDAREMQRLFEANYPGAGDLRLGEINTAVLEESLENHHAIARAEVYSNLEGVVTLDLRPPNPLARVHDAQGRKYYLLEDGNKMPLSPLYAPPVPLLTGMVPDSMRQPLSGFWKKIASDSYFANRFSGLHLTESGDWILYTTEGDHAVEVGVGRIFEKLAKLKIFYQQAWPALDKKEKVLIDTINLKYADQVIISKK